MFKPVKVGDRLALNRDIYVDETLIPQGTEVFAVSNEGKLGTFGRSLALCLQVTCEIRHDDFLFLPITALELKP